MGGCRGARGPQPVLRGGGIRPTSFQFSRSHRRWRSEEPREERDEMREGLWVRDAVDPAASSAPWGEEGRGDRRRGGRRGEEEEVGGGDLEETRGESGGGALFLARLSFLSSVYFFHLYHDVKVVSSKSATHMMQP